MRTHYNQASPKPSWVKWFFIVLLLIILAAFIYMVVLYNSIQQDKQAGFTETKEIVLHDTNLIKVNDIVRYHGAKAYHIVFGQTENNAHKIVYVPLNNEDEELIIIDESEIVSQETIENQLQKQCNQCKIISIIPGIENKELLWELTYVDDSNSYVLEYVSLYDAAQYEQFRFIEMYK